MAVIVGEGRLTLTGDVGEHLEIDGAVLIDGFTHPQVIAALAEMDDGAPLTVHLNSGGGLAYEGSAIRAALAERVGRTDIVIDGIAASAASLIAMVGQTITMAEGASLMIHDPASITIGTVADHEASIRSLNSLATSYARVYARRAGISDEAAREVMRAETWFTPEEAVAAGFADKISTGASAQIVAFPYQTYARAPRELVARAQENGWRRPAIPTAAEAAPTSREETSMAEKTPDAMAKARQDAVAEYRELRRTVMALPDAEGREELAEFLIDAGMSLEDIQVALPLAGPRESEDPVASYEARRLADTTPAGAGLGGPRGSAPRSRLDPAVIYAKRRGEG